MKIVIIEDELLTCRDLERTLKRADKSISVVTYLHSVSDAFVFFENQQHDYQLIFSDIELGDGKSFLIFDKYPPKVPVIFCTAYSEYALKAFGSFGIDYLLKPFSVETVLASLQKYRLLEKTFSNPSAANMQNFIKEMLTGTVAKVTSIIIHKGDKLVPYSLAEIAIFVKEDNHLYAVTFNKEQLLVSNNLDKTEAIAGSLFFRVNRQMLVNRNAVKDLSNYFNRKLLINLVINFNRQIILPKEKITAFLEWLTIQ